MKKKKFSKSNYLVLPDFLFRFSLPLFAPIFATQSDLLDDHLQQKSDLLVHREILSFRRWKVRNRIFCSKFQTGFQRAIDRSKNFFSRQDFFFGRAVKTCPPSPPARCGCCLFATGGLENPAQANLSQRVP